MLRVFLTDYNGICQATIVDQFEDNVKYWLSYGLGLGVNI
jgi:hypothetical protein